MRVYKQSKNLPKYPIELFEPRIEPHNSNPQQIAMFTTSLSSRLCAFASLAFVLASQVCACTLPLVLVAV